MEQYNITSIKNDLKNTLKENRYKHTLGVEQVAISLANKFGSDRYNAQVAALLHDCAKNMDPNDVTKVCKENNIELTKNQKNNPDLIHAHIGAVIAKTKYNINNIDILNAIKYHTTGRPHMSLLEKIIYIADYIEPGRYKAKNLVEIRKLSNKDIDKTLFKILEDTVIYLNEKEIKVDKLTEQAYNYYKNVGGRV